MHMSVGEHVAKSYILYVSIYSTYHAHICTYIYVATVQVKRNYRLRERTGARSFECHARRSNELHARSVARPDLHDRFLVNLSVIMYVI